MTSDRIPIRSHEITVRILERLAEAGASGVREIARATDIPRSTVHKHLQSLTELGLLAQTPDQQYHLSATVLAYAETVTTSLPHYASIVEEIEELSPITESTLFYFVRENDHCVCVYRSSPDGYYETGQKLELTTSAPGKAILAATDPAGFDGDDLEPEHGQDRGGAFADEEGALAVPVLDSMDQCLGALTVHRPYQVQESGRSAEIAGQLRGMQSEIAKQLGEGDVQDRRP
jgi:DNA-binding IclR family transcriptional regulator